MGDTKWFVPQSQGIVLKGNAVPFASDTIREHFDLFEVEIGGKNYQILVPKSGKLTYLGIHGVSDYLMLVDAGDMSGIYARCVIGGQDHISKPEGAPPEVLQLAYDVRAGLQITPLGPPQDPAGKNAGFRD